MLRDDLIRIRHMLDAAKETISFADNKTRDDLESDRMLVLSIVKSIEIVGEAASKVAMRNRLIHAYFDIDLDRVWDTVTDDLPSLAALLEDVIRSEEQ
jgi:uncharacterized protein with HEPN domain